MRRRPGPVSGDGKNRHFFPPWSETVKKKNHTANRMWMEWPLARLGRVKNCLCGGVLCPNVAFVQEAAVVKRLSTKILGLGCQNVIPFPIYSYVPQLLPPNPLHIYMLMYIKFHACMYMHTHISSLHVP